jgi:CHAT domain-containing protein
VFSAEDVLITAELRQRPLVVLSACETADPGEFLGTEVFSFCTCLLRIGARLVIGACWPVSEAAAHTFTEAFYEGLARGEEPTKAFHAAITVTRRQNSDVLFWAPFIVLVSG